MISGVVDGGDSSSIGIDIDDGLVGNGFNEPLVHRDALLRVAQPPVCSDWQVREQ